MLEAFGANSGAGVPTCRLLCPKPKRGFTVKKGSSGYFDDGGWKQLQCVNCMRPKDKHRAPPRMVNLSENNLRQLQVRDLQQSCTRRNVLLVA